MRIKQIIKDWMLPISISLGIILYLSYHWIPEIHFAGPYLEKIVKIVQPVLMFLMLFFSFCRIAPRQMRPHRWQIWLLLVQILGFSIPAFIILFIEVPTVHILLESLMVAMICPTATAAAVVTGKLGGDIPGIITYTILINIVTAIAVPTFVPLIHPNANLHFWDAFSIIMTKTSTLLIMPCLCAWLIRFLLPRFHKWLLSVEDAAFYIWAVSLCLAIATSTRALIQTKASIAILAGIAAISLIACALQFYIGKKIGKKYKHKITAGQALGQKNTVFSMWMAYTFMTPITSLVGGFYSIWHNLFNSLQLYQRKYSSKCDDALDEDYCNDSQDSSQNQDSDL